jgi:hypothetical protein
MADRKKTRLNLEMTPKARARLERLQEKTEAASLTEVIRHALIVYEDFLDGRSAPLPVAPDESGE